MTLDEIKDRINELSDGDRAELAAWLLSVDREAWDRQIEADFSPGGAGKKLLDEVDAAMKENANKIERFFREYVNGWLLGDIQLCCAQEKPLPFLVSITVFCGIDFLAGLLEGKDSGGTGFTHFIEQFFGPEYGRFAKELWKDFRCGLVHEYFPKRQGEVTWGDPTKHLTDFQGRLFLDARRLARDFESAVEKYREALLRDTGLQKNFVRRLGAIVKPPGRRCLEVGESCTVGSASIEAHKLFLPETQ